MIPELTNKPTNFDDMAAAMLRCEQTAGQSVYQHGQSVSKHFDDLMDHIKGIYTLPEGRWKLPEWIQQYKDELLANLHDRGLIDQYLTFHDCGKPYCRTPEGRFPDHANVSAYVWACVGGNEAVGELIRDDMVIHTATAEEISQKMQEWSVKDACTLLLAALCEIHSNARMFGGIDSTSFKIKWKQIDKRGRQICKHYFGVLEVVK